MIKTILDGKLAVPPRSKNGTITVVLDCDDENQKGLENTILVMPETEQEKFKKLEIGSLVSAVAIPCIIQRNKQLRIGYFANEITVAI